MGKYLLVEADGAGHVNKATMKLLFARIEDGELRYVCQHDSIATLERRMEQICDTHLKTMRKYPVTRDMYPHPIEFEIRDGHGQRLLKTRYKYYEEA